MRMRSLFSYVVDHDYGINPNPVGGVCTLAHCKFRKFPSSRRNVVELAEVGDWVAGTGGQSYESAGNGKLIYAMRVTQWVPLSLYLTAARYAGRADQFEDDFGVAGRFVLISNEYYYFGRNAIDVAHIPNNNLSEPFEKKGQGHRRHVNQTFIADFETWVRREFTPGVHGEPCGGRPPHWNSRLRVPSRPCRIC